MVKVNGTELDIAGKTVAEYLSLHYDKSNQKLYFFLYFITLAQISNTEFKSSSSVAI